MKISEEIISLPLSQLINDSISMGAFPNICKLGQVIPIFQMIPDYFVTITDQLHFFQTQAKFLKI